MSNPPQFSSPDRISLLIDFPIRLYTALRTMRLYPVSNPQVQRSNDFVLTAFKALLGNRAEESINIAFSDQKILICGEHLPDRDQARPQSQGLGQSHPQRDPYNLACSIWLTIMQRALLIRRNINHIFKFQKREPLLLLQHGNGRKTSSLKC